MHPTISFALAVGLLASCSPDGAKQHSELSSTSIVATTTNRIKPPLLSHDQPRHSPGLHNVVAYHDGCYSGGVPIGENDFDALKALGVRTIVSNALRREVRPCKPPRESTTPRRIFPHSCGPPPPVVSANCL